MSVESDELATARASARRPGLFAVGILVILCTAGVLALGWIYTRNLLDSVTEMQRASVMPAYPDIITRRLSTVHDRLEARRSDEDQAVQALKTEAGHLIQALGSLHGSRAQNLPELGQALRLWQQFLPLIKPVIDFTGDPCEDTETAISPAGAVHYAAGEEGTAFHE